MTGGAGTRPASGGTGGGASPPSSAGREAIPAIAAATIAAARPTLAHLICLPATLGEGARCRSSPGCVPMAYSRASL